MPKSMRRKFGRKWLAVSSVVFRRHIGDAQCFRLRTDQPGKSVSIPRAIGQTWIEVFQTPLRLVSSPCTRAGGGVLIV
jgi:hypothetical protein